MPHPSARPSLLLLAAAACAAAVPASAHPTAGAVGGLASGFLHPLFGLDHVVAMLAVGLWGAALGGAAVWVLPLVFPAVMIAGGAAGVWGVPLPGIEAGIAVSGLVLGLLVAFKARLPLWVAAALVGVFAVFHGHAHGTELPAAASPLTYAAGFVAASGLLHLAGIGLGTLARRDRGELLLRTGGGAIAAVGLAFLVGVL